MDNYGYVHGENGGRPFSISRSLSGAKQENSNDFLVRVNSRFKPSKKSVYYQRATKVLAVLVVILLIGIILILILYTRSMKSKICTTSQCIRSAANLKYSMDFSVDPCENFYDFCCGKWSKEHPNHGWYSSFSTFATVTEKVVIESLSVLSEDVYDSEPVAVGNAKRLYKSCVSEETTEALGLTPIYDYLTMTNLPVVPNFFNQSLSGDFKYDWVKTEVLLKRVLAMDVFIGFTVQPNLYKRNQNVIYLGLLFQSCPLPSPLKNKYNSLRKPWRRSWFRPDKYYPMEDTDEGDADDDSEEQRQKLRTKIRTNIIKRVIKEIMKNNSWSVPEDPHLQMAADVINNITYHLDDLNENYTLPEGQLSEDETRNISFKQLQELTDNNVRNPMPDFWWNYISTIFKGTNVTIDSGADLLFVTDTELEYLFTVLDYLSSQPPLHIELYMWWSAVYAMILSTSSDVTDYVLSQTALYYDSSPDFNKAVFVRSRSLDCCELVNKYMGWAVSYAIADKIYANETKPKVEKMIKDIKDAFIEHVQGIRWMDDQTKRVTLEKSKEMISFIGYPDWLFEEGTLDRKYAGLEINETTYLANMVNIIMQYTTETLTSLRLDNPRDWSTEATTVNAFNSFSDNAINVPMAILNYPLYDLGLEVLNYGSIGSILGHELTHGFDNTGRKHDKYGNYVQWWSNKTIETFENMTKCFIEQYDSYTIDGVKGHVKGKATLGENLADNGGLNQAYTAYKHYQQKHGEEPKLPGFERYSSDQLFFIAYGSIWCETTTLEYLKNQLEYDEHCPNAIRVIGTLQNSEDFAKAYKCPPDSFMNPEKPKCKIW